jgi:hypothetical protein
MLLSLERTKYSPDSLFTVRLIAVITQAIPACLQIVLP